MYALFGLFFVDTQYNFLSSTIGIQSALLKQDTINFALFDCCVDSFYTYLNKKIPLKIVVMKLYNLNRIKYIKFVLDINTFNEKHKISIT